MPLPLIVWAGIAATGAVSARYLHKKRKPNVQGLNNDSVTLQQTKYVTNKPMVKYAAVAVLAFYLANKE